VREVAGAAGPVRQLSLPLGPTIGRDGTGGTAVMPGTDRDRVLADAGLSEEEIAALERAGLFG
jgi:crotonobetainyl-CoA:carnitine CoA-transferase CaiB-like acyl-CoA transferase